MKTNTKQYIKLTKTNGFDFHTGKTINYRESIGKIVKCPNKDGNELCSDNVIHASDCFFEALQYAELPCSIFIVSGKPVNSQEDKHGFKEFNVMREVDTTNWKISYYKIMKYMIEDTKNNFDNIKFDYVVKAIDQVIQVWNNAIKTGSIDESAAESAAKSAWSAAKSAAESAAKSAWSAAKSVAESAAKSAWSAAKSVAWSAESVAWSVAWSAAESAAWSAESAIKKKKLIEYSNKFIEYLGNPNITNQYRKTNRNNCGTDL